ncbi:MAG: hypothetical protein ACW98F_04690 [Candidatus Hodarchaeales archaeon]
MGEKLNFKLVLLSILMMSIFSQFYIQPEATESGSETVIVSTLQGRNPKGVTKPASEYTNNIETTPIPQENSKELNNPKTIPIKYLIEGGEENDVDNDVSNVDGSEDLGIETSFINAQGTTLDSQYMQIQETTVASPSITIDNISPFNGTTNRIDFSHTVYGGTNRLLLVFIQTDSGMEAINVTFDGLSLELVDRTESVAQPPQGPSIEIWKQRNPNLGAANGSVIFEASDDVAVTIISYTGVDQDNPIDIGGLNKRTGPTRNSSISISSRVGDLAQDVFSTSWDGVPEGGSSQTRRWLTKLGIQPRWVVGSTLPGANSVTFFWETVNLKDSVHIAFSIRRAPSVYKLDLEYQWTDIEYRRQLEELAIYTGDFSIGAEELKVEVWDGSWVPLLFQPASSPLQSNSWNNVSITPYLTSPTLTIRFRGTEEIDDISLDIWNIDLMLIVISAENVAPSAGNLTLIPDPIMSNETLYLDYTYSDPNNDNESGTEIRWYKYNETGDEWYLLPAYNNSLFISTSALIKNDKWRATVKPKDGTEFGNISTSSNRTIQNTPPKAYTPNILPANPKTGNDLTASYSWSDSDIGDTDSNSIIYWYKDNGTGFLPQTDYTNQSLLPSSITRKNDQWKFEITPSDGEGYGNINFSQTITIQNTLPILSVTINDYSTPQTVADDQDLISNYTYFDADNQDNSAIDVKNESSLNIQWWKYNFGNGEFEPNAIANFTIDKSQTTTGDLWRCEMNISDDSGYSSTYSSPTISIDQAPNELPSAIWINLTKSDAKAEGFLFVDFTYSDTDGSNDSGIGESIRWYRNSVYQAQFEDIQNLSTVQFVRGDEWYAEVRVRDEYDWGNWSVSETITIMNSAPTIVSIEILAFTGTTIDNLITNYIPTDIDGDSVITSASKIVWYNNSVEVSSLENHTEVSSSFTRKHQEWKFEVYLYDGSDWSSPFLSPGLTIQNTIPTIHNVTLIGGHNTTDDITILYDFVDIDGDNETGTSYTWALLPGGSIPKVPSGTLSSSHSWFIAGTDVFCIIYISDGEFIDDVGIWTLDFGGGTVRIGNSDPDFISDPTIQNTEGTLIFTVQTGIKTIYSATDADQVEGNTPYGITVDQGYVIGSSYRWYRNGESTDLTGHIVDSAELVKGDVWVVSVLLQDNDGGKSEWKNSSEILIINSPPDFLNLWFADRATGEILNDTTHVNISIKIHFIFDDPDIQGGDTNWTDIQVFWYWRNGTGLYELKFEYNNMLWINSENLSKGDYWLVQVAVFDGEAWSPIKNTTKALRIMNSESVLSNLHFIFDSDNDFVNPQSRVDEFYVENENINITYKYEDYDNDSENVKIRWFVQDSNGTIAELHQYENATSIPSDATSPGELWWANLRTYDEMIPGMQLNTTKVLIVYYPELGELNFTPGDSNDGEYQFTIQLTNYNTSEEINVEFQFSNNITLQGEALGNGVWSCSINLTEDIGKTISISITTSMSNHGTSFFIISDANFPFLVEDLTAPRIIGEPEIILDDPLRPTNVTIRVAVEENYAEIIDVLLYYTIANTTAGSSSTVLAAGELGPIIMSLYDDTGALPIYSASITNLKLSADILLELRITTRDSLNNTNPGAYTSPEPDQIDYSPKVSNPLEFIIPVIIGMLALFIAVSIGYVAIRQKQSKKASEKKSTSEKLAFLTDTYTILVTSSAGVPVWDISNILYKSDESLTGTLSGLSVGIDAFLESFQSDFIAQMSDIDLSRDHPEAKTSYRLSVIEQNKIQIMILGSLSYRIFVFLKEIPSSFLRNMFLKAIKDLQQNLPLYDTGIINETVLGPNIRRILRKHLPIGLLEPFKIDLDRLAYFDSLLQKNAEAAQISRGALNVLKFLVVTNLTPPTTSSTKQALLKAYDKTVANYPQRHSGILLYSDVMGILSQVGGFDLKVVSEALWRGIDDRVKILIPF